MASRLYFNMLLFIVILAILKSLPSVIFTEIKKFTIPYMTGFFQTGDKYYISERNETFLHAWVQCKARGLQLATIESATENLNIQNYLTLIGTKPENCYWIGGIRLNNGAWVWVDSARPIIYTNWAGQEPVVSQKTDYCLQLGKDYGKSEPDGWEAVLCSSERYYICQRHV